jgi:CRISPR-associated endonuclease Csn1
MRGMIMADLDFLDNIGVSWDKISIRDERLEAISELTQAEKEARQAAITRMIGMEINPKIRHRLTLLDHILDEVTADGVLPDRVVLEFAREEWLGPKRKKELLEFQAERKQQNITAREALEGNASPRAILKYQLYKEQNAHCIFCGDPIGDPDTTHVANKKDLDFSAADLAHIVPDSQDGPRAYVNLVLACKSCNSAQKDKYHADLFDGNNVFRRSWDSFMNDVAACSTMRPFKKKLLCTKSLEEAKVMVQNKTALQETAWIAKLARVLICLKFGWKLDAEGEQRRIVVVTGSVTNRVASKYGLYSLLGGPERVKKLADGKAAIEAAIKNVEAVSDDELDKLCDDFPKEWKMKKRKGADHWDKDFALWWLRRLHIANEDGINEKDRNDDRHHALDAMVLSFLPHWAGNPGKSLYFGLPPGRDWKEELRHYLEGLYPEVLIPVPPEMEKSFYGVRKVGAKLVPTKRFVLREIAYTGLPPTFSLSVLKKAAVCITDCKISNKVFEFANHNPTEKAWLAFCRRLELEGLAIGKPRISRIRLSVSDNLNEFADFSKDGRGAWRKGSSNIGWFICEFREHEGAFKIVPVYAHDSKVAVEITLKRDALFSRIVMYLAKADVVTVENDIMGGKKALKEPLQRGTYSIASIKADQRIRFRNNAGHTFNPISIDLTAIP